MAATGEPMQVDDPQHEPLETTAEEQPIVEMKPEVEVVHQHPVSTVAESSPRGSSAIVTRLAEAQTMMQAEDILKNNVHRRAAMAGLLCDLVEDDCSAMSVTLKVCDVIWWDC
jgi:hypothetical protein